MDTRWNKPLVCLFLISEDGTWWYHMVNSHLSHILGGQKITNNFMFIIPGWLIRTALPTHTVEAPWATANTADSARAPTAGFILEPDFLYGHRHPAWRWPWPKKEAIQLPNPGVPRYPRFAMFNRQPQNPPSPSTTRKNDPFTTPPKLLQNRAF